MENVKKPILFVVTENELPSSFWGFEGTYEQWKYVELPDNISEYTTQAQNQLIKDAILKHYHTQRGALGFGKLDKFGKILQYFYFNEPGKGIAFDVKGNSIEDAPSIPRPNEVVMNQKIKEGIENWERSLPFEEERYIRLFQPFIFVETETIYPLNRISTIIAMSNCVERFKILEVPKHIQKLPDDKKIEAISSIIRSHYKNGKAVINGNLETNMRWGPILGYTYCASYYDYYSFSVEGEYLGINENPNVYRPVAAPELRARFGKPLLTQNI